jgi:hypothetical protein
MFGWVRDDKPGVNGEVSARYQKRDLGKKGNVIGVDICVGYR